MSTAIAKVEPQEMATAPQTPRGILTKEALKESSEQRKLLSEYVKQQMVPDVDFGIIPGTKKPTLLKPGAEKLVELFRCTPKFALVKATDDFDRGLFAYTFRVRLLQRDAQVVLAEGYGSANSREARYRWRQSNRKCPACGNETIIKGKAEYGGGFICFAKKGGCGEKFRDNDAAITEQEVGQVENEDIASQANAILKVAKKRALVDGALALARVSDLFTQDMDEAVVPQEAEHAAQSAPKAKATAKPVGKPWERIVFYAEEVKFEGGKGNKLLWELAARVVPDRKWPQWTEADYLAIEKALRDSMPVEEEQPSGNAPENDIPF